MRRFTKTLERAEYGTNVYGCEEERIKTEEREGYKENMIVI
jgi:hypothetical protein